MQPDAAESAVANPFVTRRRFVALVGSGVLGALAVGPARGQLRALAAAAVASDDRYGPLGDPDEHGVRVPEGFVARLIGRSGDPVASTDHVWHGAPDGGGCFPAADGGHVYVSNSELAGGRGGVSAVEFDEFGAVRAARTVLSGTSMNCSGGVTPWNTWLSCEEVHPTGQVWECDPYGQREALVRPAMGAFRHEAVAVDPVRRQMFLTEDRPDGRLYRFRPTRWPDLDDGTLEVARVVDGAVSWLPTDSLEPDRSAESTSFDGGEGAVVIDDSLFFTTKGDRRVWEFDLRSARLDVFHDCVARPETALTHVDNLAVHPVTRDLFVAEDGGDMELCMLTTRDEQPVVTSVVRFEGHTASEVTGPAFSPDGRFLYVSSQRGADGHGITVQVEGPWVRWIERIDTGADARTSARRLGNAEPVGD